jgi:hypothetical protein
MLDTTYAATERTREAVRTITGGNVLSPRVGDFIAVLDTNLTATLNLLDALYRTAHRDAQTDTEREAARRDWVGKTNAARIGYEQAVSTILAQEKAAPTAQMLHAQHETRDEAVEATAALRAMVEGGAL